MGTDAQGRRVDFRNTIVIMTSNLGAQYNLGADRNDEGDAEEERKKTRAHHLEAIRRHFAPEFINRIDEIIVFNPLQMASMRPITDIQMNEVEKLINSEGRSVQLRVSEAARDWLSQMGFSKQYGARPLKRCVQNLVMKPLSVLILEGKIHDSALVEIDYDFDADKLKFEVHKIIDAEAEIVHASS